MNESELKKALRSLPDLEPPDSVWTNVRARVPAPRSHFPSIAAAVALAVTLSLLVVLDRRIEAVDHIATIDAKSQIEALVHRSQQLEKTLRGTPRFSDDSPTMRVLASRIAVLDADISRVGRPDSVDMEAMLQQRVSLMESYRDLRRDRNINAVRRVIY